MLQITHLQLQPMMLIPGVSLTILQSIKISSFLKNRGRNRDFLLIFFITHVTIYLLFILFFVISNNIF